MNTIKVSSLSTPVGPFHLIFQAHEEGDIIKAAGFGALDDLRKRLPEALQHLEVEEVALTHPYVRKVHAYFQGDLHALQSVPYEQTGGAFTQSVWRALLAIAPGSTISYKELALRAGNPAAVRAAGTACGQNHVMLFVPCHRVVKSGGQIGNYLYGAPIKAWLLAHEEKYKTL